MPEGAWPPASLSGAAPRGKVAFEAIPREERQRVDAAPKLVRVVAEPAAPIVFFREVVTLEKGAQRAIQHHDPLLQDLFEIGRAVDDC